MKLILKKHFHKKFCIEQNSSNIENIRIGLEFLDVTNFEKF